MHSVIEFPSSSHSLSSTPVLLLFFRPARPLGAVTSAQRLLSTSASAHRLLSPAPTGRCHQRPAAAVHFRQRPAAAVDFRQRPEAPPPIHTAREWITSHPPHLPGGRSPLLEQRREREGELEHSKLEGRSSEVEPTWTRTENLRGPHPPADNA